MIYLTAKRGVLTSDRAATTLVAYIRKSCRGLGWVVATIIVLRGCAVAAESASVSQRDVVRSCAALRSPRHGERLMRK
jgi:hypothetical protein